MCLGSLLPARPFTNAEAEALGFTRRRLAGLVRSGELRHVVAGVHVPSVVPDSLELRAAAVALVVEPSSVVCDRTAAWLWGVDVFDFAQLELLPPIETFVLRGRTRTRRRGCAGGERDLAEEDIVVVGGVRVTTPLRTAADLACHLSPRRALAALDAFMREHAITERELRRILLRYYRRRGVVQARELVGYADPRAESPGESWVRYEIVSRGLPRPEPQHWVVYGGRKLFRLDLAYPHLRVAVEYDGREFHEGDEQSDHDEARRAWLEGRGWTVIVVTKDDFTPQAVDAWIQELRDALPQAA
jgi:hypothetical protein